MEVPMNIKYVAEPIQQTRQVRLFFADEQGRPDTFVGDYSAEQADSLARALDAALQELGADAGSPSRLDRVEADLEQLRSEVRGGK